ncbi:MAG: NfeD family protein [Oscillospiraceae bacterium]|nr:NfeD family protein [Oscillospiraceae bacterium]MCD8066867.1 NfeD family protein [Oscillospiraceae bacterium]MCD8191258.1 NfeD family protein [Oscillospiraceae bacterium]MCD8255195.1 NfeD family protein [Oscillospiraceae bacterium]MCD8342919.1 NfeD family protein [Oscillospiraceae bacterium]
MTLFWALAAIVFIIIEAVTPGLAAIWFALGAIAALVSERLGAPIWLQAVWFAAVSLVTLALTRPLAKKYVNGKAQPTNADRLIGMLCSVSEGIDNIRGTGSVFADGKTWTARSTTGAPITAGTVVKIDAIEGVKLMVSPPERE